MKTPKKQPNCLEWIIHPRCDNRGQSALVFFSFVYPTIKTVPKLTEPCSLQPFLSSHYLISGARVELVSCSRLCSRQMKRNAAWLTEHSRLDAANWVKPSLSLLLLRQWYSPPQTFRLMNLQYEAVWAANQSSHWWMQRFLCTCLHLDPGLKGLLNKARLSPSHLFCSISYDTVTHTTKCLTNDGSSQRKLLKWKSWFITLCNSRDFYFSCTFLSHFFSLWLFSSAALAQSFRHFHHLKHVIS